MDIFDEHFVAKSYKLNFGFEIEVRVFGNALKHIVAYLKPSCWTPELNVGMKNRLHIVQISDVHLNGLRSVKSLQQWVQRINDLSPDLIVFTGDLLDIPAHLQKEELSILATLNAKVAKLAVSGNHDFYSHHFDFPDILEKMGFLYLDNANKYNSYNGIDMSEKANYLKLRNKYGWWVGFVYIYGLLDAIVEAHLHPFNEIMNEDLEKPKSEDNKE